MQAKAKLLLTTGVQETLQLVATALKELDPEGEVQVDPVYLSVAIDTPSSWRGLGEHVVVTVDASKEGSVVEVSSRGVRWQLIDSARIGETSKPSRTGWRETDEPWIEGGTYSRDGNRS